jgi:hypothetical protein
MAGVINIDKNLSFKKMQSFSMNSVLLSKEFWRKCQGKIKKCLGWVHPIPKIFMLSRFGRG